MDSFNSQQTQLDLSKLSDFEKRELQQNLQNEMQKAKIQECMPLPFPPRPRLPKSSLHLRLSASFAKRSWILANSLCGFSCPQPNRHLLDEMHDEGDN